MLLILIIIILLLSKISITISSYSFDVLNEQRQEILTFVGNAIHLDEVNDDLNHFCKKEVEKCKEKSFTDQILIHANRFVVSKKYLEELNLEYLCKGTIVGPDAAVLAEMANEIINIHSNIKIKKYVEIGSYLGCSTFIIANLTQRNVLIYAHDIWLEEMKDLRENSDPPSNIDDYFLKFYNEVIERNYEMNIIPIRGNSNYTINIHKNESISLAFIDGDHSYYGCLWDLRNIWGKMLSGGLIYVHDYWTIDSLDPVALCVHAFVEEVGSSKAQLSRVGTTTFARILVATNNV